MLGEGQNITKRPPGFKQFPVLDVNNNARNSDRNGLVQKDSGAISSSNRGEDEAEANNEEQNKVLATIGRLAVGLKDKMQLMIEKQKGNI